MNPIQISGGNDRSNIIIYCSFLLVQKRTKKAHPKTITACFREGRFDLTFVLL